MNNDELYSYAFKGFLNANNLCYNETKEDLLSKSDIENYEKDYSPFQPWHIDFINVIDKIFDFENKTVLEIGGSNFPKDLIKNKLMAKKWVCVDTPYWSENQNAKHFSELKVIDSFSEKLDDVLEHHDYILYRGITDDIPPDFYDKFDICVSLACLEHIQNITLALDVIYKSLRKGGVFYTHWGPLWSGPYGSHFWMWTVNLTCSNPQFIPPFAHLLYSQKEIYEILLENKSVLESYNTPLMLEDWAREIIDGPLMSINKYFYEDYEYFVKQTPFRQKFIQPFFVGEVADETIDKLRICYPNYTTFAQAARMILIK